MRQLHIAVAQINARVGDVSGNLARIERQVCSAGAVGVELILFAETTIHAFDCSADNLALAVSLDSPLARTVSDMAAAHKLIIVAGLLEKEDGRIYNSHLVAWPDGRRACQRKHGLTPGEIAGGLAAGPRARTVFTFNGVRTAIVICADGGVPGLKEDLVRDGVELRLVPTGGGGSRKEMLTEAELDTPEGIAAYAADRTKVFKPEAVMSDRMDCAFASANALGHDGRSAWHRGHCMIVDRHGLVRAQIPGTNVLEHQQDQMAHAILEFP